LQVSSIYGGRPAALIFCGRKKFTAAGAHEISPIHTGEIDSPKM
jgi:hypothetical protein